MTSLIFLNTTESILVKKKHVMVIKVTCPMVKSEKIRAQRHKNILSVGCNVEARMEGSTYKQFGNSKL
jgi:hypothetical protein